MRWRWNVIRDEVWVVGEREDVAMESQGNATTTYQKPKLDT
jgi:hypothetical protein